MAESVISSFLEISCSVLGASAGQKHTFIHMDLCKKGHICAHTVELLLLFMTLVPFR